jgi:hypothetical protein
MTIITAADLEKAKSFGPAFDSANFNPKAAAPDPKPGKVDPLSSGFNDAEGFWRPDALPGLNPNAVGRKPWNPLECAVGNDYLQNPNWHPHGAPFGNEEDPPSRSSMADCPWYAEMFRNDK